MRLSVLNLTLALPPGPPRPWGVAPPPPAETVGARRLCGRQSFAKSPRASALACKKPCSLVRKNDQTFGDGLSDASLRQALGKLERAFGRVAIFFRPSAEEENEVGRTWRACTCRFITSHQANLRVLVRLRHFARGQTSQAARAPTTPAQNASSHHGLVGQSSRLGLWLARLRKCSSHELQGA